MDIHSPSPCLIHNRPRLCGDIDFTPWALGKAYKSRALFDSASNQSTFYQKRQRLSCCVGASTRDEALRCMFCGMHPVTMNRPTFHLRLPAAHFSDPILSSIPRDRGMLNLSLDLICSSDYGYLRQHASPLTEFIPCRRHANTRDPHAALQLGTYSGIQPTHSIKDSHAPYFIYAYAF